MNKNNEEEIGKKSIGEEQSEFKQMPMVGWFDPGQLAVTVVKTIISSIFGAFSDKREIQSALSVPQKYDYSQKEEIWIDYMSDTGDGFHPTITMANILSEDSKVVDGIQTFNGDILILGGDQVYPVASRENYNNRFRGPFEAVCQNKKSTKESDLFSIPGNHDWYDGLSNFIKLFCQERTIGKWKTKQQRSYFAIKLPHGWWLWGIDIQLEADIDYPQLQYFDQIADEMSQGDKIILCTAEPSWIYTTKKNDTSYHNLKFFEQRYIIDKHFDLIITLAGDMHHYAHYYLNKNGKVHHKIISGGGGACVLPTHNLKSKLELREGIFSLIQTYPTKEKSINLAFWNFAFPWINKQFLLFMGLFYLLIAWSLQAATKHNQQTFIHISSKLTPSFQNIQIYLLEVSKTLSESPSIAFLFLIVIFGLYKFTDSRSNQSKYIGIVGGIHGVMHLFNVLVLIWLLSYYLDPTTIVRAVVFSILFIFVGGIMGCMLMAIYLMISNLIFGIHDSESFGALKMSGYKNFLRIYINKDELTVYPVGVEKVPKWRKEGDTFVPDKEVNAVLIDRIITIKNK